MPNQQNEGFNQQKNNTGIQNKDQLKAGQKDRDMSEKNTGGIDRDRAQKPSRGDSVSE